MTTDLQQFVNRWGFCPHTDGDTHCGDCSDPSQRSFSQSDLLELTHDRQVAIFGFCTCEDGPQVYDDCPTIGDAA